MIVRNGKSDTTETGNNLPVSKITESTSLKDAANIHTSSDLRRMAQKVLDDFRKLSLGQISLELPS